MRIGIVSGCVVVRMDPVAVGSDDRKAGEVGKAWLEKKLSTAKNNPLHKYPPPGKGGGYFSLSKQN